VNFPAVGLIKVYLLSHLFRHKSRKWDIVHPCRPEWEQIHNQPTRKHRRCDKMKNIQMLKEKCSNTFKLEFFTFIHKTVHCKTGLIWCFCFGNQLSLIFLQLKVVFYLSIYLFGLACFLKHKFSRTKCISVRPQHWQHTAQSNC